MCGEARAWRQLASAAGSGDAVLCLYLLTVSTPVSLDVKGVISRYILVSESEQKPEMRELKQEEGTTVD